MKKARGTRYTRYGGATEQHNPELMGKRLVRAGTSLCYAMLSYRIYVTIPRLYVMYALALALAFLY